MTGSGAVRYAARDLAVLVPTKDRPAKLGQLLDSLAGQSEICGRVIIIDGGDSVRDVVMRYAGRLPVEHHVCRPPGQIRQRNMGIALLDERTPPEGPARQALAEAEGLHAHAASIRARLT